MLIFFIGTLIFFLFLHHLRYFYKQRQIYCWRKNLNLKKHEAIFELLYQNTNGFLLSALASQKAIEYVYGEIEFESFIALLSLCKPTEETIFYDLGCGTGKAVLATTMAFNIQKSCGIEILPALYKAAEAQKEQLALNSAYKIQADKISFYQGDFLLHSIQEANLVFINATAYFGDYWITISHYLERLKPGIIVITTSKAIKSNLFIMMRVTLIQMSWGVVKAYIQKRRHAIHAK